MPLRMRLRPAVRARLIGAAPHSRDRIEPPPPPHEVLEQQRLERQWKSRYHIQFLFGHQWREHVKQLMYVRSEVHRYLFLWRCCFGREPRCLSAPSCGQEIFVVDQGQAIKPAQVAFVGVNEFWLTGEVHLTERGMSNERWQSGQCLAYPTMQAYFDDLDAHAILSSLWRAHLSLMPEAVRVKMADQWVVFWDYYATQSSQQQLAALGFMKQAIQAMQFEEVPPPPVTLDGITESPEVCATSGLALLSPEYHTGVQIEEPWEIQGV